MVRCPQTLELRKTSMETLLMKLLKNRPDFVDVDLIIACCEDILRCLEDNAIKDKYETIQQYVGMKEIFRECIAKD